MEQSLRVPCIRGEESAKTKNHDVQILQSSPAFLPLDDWFDCECKVSRLTAGVGLTVMNLSPFNPSDGKSVRWR